jgi:putative aminopeptidase FrvX|tara:strand:- start:2595 stop:3626 length:1032 start_codon:yes stop_codon:yes gene_type:complete
MNKKYLKEVLSIPSISGNESMVRDHIKEFATINNIKYNIDSKGNIYLTKGSNKKGEFYPCVVSHIDTVHREHIPLIEKKQFLKIVENTITTNNLVETTLTARLPNSDTLTGIGGDDKCGVYVCLEMFKKFDKLKGAFFVEEEIGMLGSKESDDKFFLDVGYAIQFDAPSANWITEICSGTRLFDSEFKENIKKTLTESGYTNYSNDPFTDVNQLAKKYDFCCLNLGCGYYKQHSKYEYVIVEEVEKSLNAGEKLINELGTTKYIHKKDKLVLNENIYSQYTNDMLYFDDFEEYDDFFGYEDELNVDLEVTSETIVNMVLTLHEYGFTEKEISSEIKKYIQENL